MKKRAILGILVTAVFSLLLAGTALANAFTVTYPPGDPKTGKITEWEITPDGRVHCAGGPTGTNGFSGGIVETGKNGQPILTTFDNPEDMAAALKARGWEPFSFPGAKKAEGPMTPLLGGNATVGIGGETYNPSAVRVNTSVLPALYSFSATQITYYVKDPFAFLMSRKVGQY